MPKLYFRLLPSSSSYHASSSYSSCTIRKNSIRPGSHINASHTHRHSSSKAGPASRLLSIYPDPSIQNMHSWRPALEVSGALSWHDILPNDFSLIYFILLQMINSSFLVIVPVHYNNKRISTYSLSFIVLLTLHEYLSCTSRLITKKSDYVNLMAVRCSTD